MSLILFLPEPGRGGRRAKTYHIIYIYIYIYMYVCMYVCMCVYIYIYIYIYIITTRLHTLCLFVYVLYYLFISSFQYVLCVFSKCCLCYCSCCSFCINHIFQVYVYFLLGPRLPGYGKLTASNSQHERQHQDPTLVQHIVRTVPTNPARQCAGVCDTHTRCAAVMSGKSCYGCFPH